MISKATSDGAAECFVYITLPGATEPVTAGRFIQERDRSGVTVGRFVYGRSYLARPDAVARMSGGPDERRNGVVTP